MSQSSRRVRGSSARTCVDLCARRSLIECLEPRRMLAAEFVNGTWTITGDESGAPARDRIVIRQAGDDSKLEAVINGKVAGAVAKAAVFWINASGGGGNDSIRLESGLGDINTNGARVSLSGGEGDDTLIGSATSETLMGGDGDDLLLGKDNHDEMLGGDGNDTLAGGAAHDRLDGGPGDDSLAGDHGHDMLSGGGGADRLAGAQGKDTLAGSTGPDALLGGAGKDRLHGGFDDDTLRGDKDDDTLAGGLGRDRLLGGAGADTVYRQPDGADRPKFDRFDLKRNEELINPVSRVGSAEALKKKLIDDAVERWSGYLGTSFTPAGQHRLYHRQPDGTLKYIRDDSFTLSVCGDWSMGHWQPGALCAPMGGADYSGTNTQEAAVDEADLVKTDGQYLYILHRPHDPNPYQAETLQAQLVVIDATPAEEARVISRTPIDGDAEGIYLRDGRVVVLSQVRPAEYPYREIQDAWWSTEDIANGTVEDVNLRAQVQSKVSIFDVSKPAAPRLVEETAFDGFLRTSRAVDESLYLVVGSSLDLPGPQRTWHALPKLAPDFKGEIGKPTATGPDGDPVHSTAPYEYPEGEIRHPKGYFMYETPGQYRARLEAMPLKDLAPGYQTRVPQKGAAANRTSGTLLRPHKTYFSDDPRDQYSDWWNTFSLVLIDLDDGQPGPTDSASGVGWDGAVYASAESLYLANSTYDTPMGEWSGEMRTDLYKFAIGDAAVDLAATGQVPGWVLNSFSMDEEGTQFRIATTSSSSDGTSNNVFILAEQGNELTITGGVTGLAFTERLYSARFIGDRGYLVTFRQIDPLFTLDLSDPASPEVLGELKIPGFSSYLHPIEDDLLIGVGRDVDETTNRTKGVQVSLFDVADPANPKRIDVETFGEDWATSSDVDHDHHAFAWFAAQQTLALPITRYTGDYPRTAMESFTQLLRADRATGLTPLGRVSHAGEALRNVRIGQHLYSISADAIKVVLLREPDDVLAVITL